MASGGALGRLSVVLGLDSAEFTSGLNKADYQSKQSLDKIAKNAAIAGAAIGTAFVAAGAAMTIMVKKSMDNMDAMSKLAQSSGIAIDSLTSLGYAADLSGVNVETLGANMVKLTKNMSDAAKGTGDAKDAFSAMGVSVLDANGKLIGADDMLGELADKFAQYKDGAEKTALAVAIFGRAGAQMVPFLNAGRQGLADAQAEASKLGITLSQETASAAEAFNDNLSRLAYTQEGWINAITAEVLPALVDYSDFMVAIATDTDDVHGAVKSLSEFIGLQEWLQDVGKNIATTLDELAMLYKAVQVVIGSFENLFQKSREWMAYDAVDKTGLVALINPELAKQQTAEYEQVLKDRNDTIDRNNKTLFELIDGDNRKYRDLWDKQAEVGMGGISQLAPNIVKPASGGGKGTSKKAARSYIASDLDEMLVRMGEADEWLEQYEIKTEKTFDKTGEFAVQAARNIESALGDGLFKILKGDFDNIGQAFADMMLRMAAEAQAAQLAKAMFGDYGSSGQMGGIIGNIAGSLFGGGVPNTSYAPAHGFDSGGYTGSGGKYEPKGIVHAEEGVLNRDEIRAIGGPSGFNALRRAIKGREHAMGGMAGSPGLVGGGPVPAGGVSLNITNNSSQPVGASQPKISLDSMGRMVIDVMLNDLHKNGPYSRQLKGAM